MNRKSAETMRELKGIAEYLSYINRRIKFLEIIHDVEFTSMELKYCIELKKRIKEWGATHHIAYKYFKGELDSENGCRLMGISKSTFDTIMGKQRAEFIKYVEHWEEELERKYSFFQAEIDCTED